MNITAEQIKQNCSGTRLIEQEIKTLLKTFQSEIIQASRDGFSKVVVAIPTNFNVGTVTNAEAQTIIYHRLIKELKDNGFDIRISMSPDSVTYCIGWTVRNNENELRNMRSVIASHIVKEEKKDH